VHLVGFIIEIYYDARSYKCQRLCDSLLIRTYQCFYTCSSWKSAGLCLGDVGHIILVSIILYRRGKFPYPWITWQNPRSSPTWEGKSNMITKEIPCILLNWKVINVFTGAHKCNHYTTLSIYHSEWPRSMHHTHLHVRSFTLTIKNGGHPKWINTWHCMRSFLIPCGLKALTWWKFIHILPLFWATACSPSEMNKHSHKSRQLPVKISMWISDNP
jgi:hypothetical protein